MERADAGRRRLVDLALLAMATWSATYSRVAIGPLQESIQGSLGLSDSQVALLQGMALAVPIAVVSIPLGLLADQISRKRILAFSLALALLAYVLSALSTTFGQLIAARCLAGLAVPGIFVAGYSMASDLCSRSERGRGAMLLAIGEVTGGPAAFALGGALIVQMGWTHRVRLGGMALGDWNESLMAMSAVLLPVLLSLFLLREPARMERLADRVPVRAVWRELWRYRNVAIPLQLTRATLFIGDGAVYVWGAPLLARRFHLPADRIGRILGAGMLIGGLLGPALGGPMVDWCARRGGPRQTMKIMAVIAFVSVPVGFFALMPSVPAVGVLLGAFLVLGGIIGAAAMTLTLVVIPGELRGLNIGISIVVGSLLFIGVAPLTVSSVSALLGGQAKIGEALAIVCGIASLLTAMVVAFSSRYFPSAGRADQTAGCG